MPVSVGIQLPTVDGLRLGYRDIRPVVRGTEDVVADEVRQQAEAT